jgi:hypothetical protein
LNECSAYRRKPPNASVRTAPAPAYAPAVAKEGHLIFSRLTRQRGTRFPPVARVSTATKNKGQSNGASTAPGPLSKEEILEWEGVLLCHSRTSTAGGMGNRNIYILLLNCSALAKRSPTPLARTMSAPASASAGSSRSSSSSSNNNSSKKTSCIISVLGVPPGKVDLIARAAHAIDQPAS